MVGWFNKRRRREQEDGAALVEMAVVMPLLVLLLFGMVDAGWAFMNHLEVRHGAREASRLAAVSNTPFSTGPAIITESCARMSTTSGDVTVALALPDSNGNIGSAAQVTVTKNHQALTGFIPLLDNLTLTSTVETRLEQVATWAATSDDCAP